MLPRVASSIPDYLAEIPQYLQDKAKLRVIQGHVALQDFEHASSLLDTWVEEVSDESRSAFEQERRKLKRLQQRAFNQDKKRWAGFFNKLGDGGGYMTAEDEARIKREMELERELLREDHKNSCDIFSHPYPVDTVSDVEREQILGLSSPSSTGVDTTQKSNVNRDQ